MSLNSWRAPQHGALQWGLVALVLTLFSSGCGSVTPLARSERAAVGFGIGLNYCLEPAASVQSDRMILGAAGGVDSPYGVGRADGSQRSHEVAEIMLFARENLYRICEAHQNKLLEPAPALKLWEQIIKMSGNLIAMRNRHETVLLVAGVRNDIERINAALARSSKCDPAMKVKKEQCERRLAKLRHDKKRNERLLDMMAPSQSAPDVRPKSITQPKPQTGPGPQPATNRSAPKKTPSRRGPFSPPSL